MIQISSMKNVMGVMLAKYIKPAQMKNFLKDVTNLFVGKLMLDKNCTN